MKSLIFLSSTIISLLSSCALYGQGGYNDHVLDSLLRALQVAKDDTNKTKLYYKVADRYGLHDPKMYSKYVHIGKAHAERHHFDRAKAVFISMLGAIKHDQGDIDSALWYYNKSYDLHKKNGDERNMALMLVDISNVYNWSGNNVEAMRYLTRAVPVLEKIKDYENLTITYGNFATLYVQEENFKKALEYELKALKSANDGKVDHKYAGVYNTLGTIYAGLKDTVRATKLMEQSIGYAKKHHRNYELAQAYGNMATYSHDNQQRLTYLLEARKIWKQINPEHPIATSVIGSIGELFLEQAIEGKKAKDGKSIISRAERDRLLHQAGLYIDTALTLSKKNGYMQNVMFYTGRKAELQAEQGDYKQAYTDFTDHLALYDSLYSQENKNRISQIESENELLIRDQRISEKEARIREMWLYGVILLFGTVLVFSFFLYRNKISHLRLKNSIAQQEAERREAELNLQNKIMESELKVLRTQMNPHFIFNVLNNIDSYILVNDRKAASRLIQKFAKLSRLVLENSIHNLVPVVRDWEALQLYVELEALRFSNEFEYSFHVQEDLDLHKLLVPPMLIQPLVENAIHHGLRTSTGPDKKVTVTLEIQESDLLFTVSDNGIGFNLSQENKEATSDYKQKSIGLDSIKERLELFNLQQDTAKANIIIQHKDAVDDETVVRVYFPVLYNSI